MPLPRLRSLSPSCRRTLLMVLATGLLAIVMSTVITAFMVQAREAHRSAVQVTRMRPDSVGLMLRLEAAKHMVASGEIEVSDERREIDEVEERFDATFPLLVELDPTIAAEARAEMDDVSRGLRHWYRLAATEVVGGIVDQAAMAADTEQVEAASQRLDRALAVAVDRAQHRADRAGQRSVWMVWMVTLSAASVAVFLGRRLLRAHAAAASAEGDRRADERLRSLVTHNDEILAVIDRDGTRIPYVSPSVVRVLGHSQEVFQAKGTALVVPEDRRLLLTVFHRIAGRVGGHERTEIRARHADGSVVHLEIDLTNLIEEPAIGGVVLNARDISDRVQLQHDLAHQANHDALTGLANRAWFAEQLNRVLHGDAARHDISVVVVDLDGFKEINDSLGHGAGDHVLVTVAARLATLTRQRDCVARLGGDEFAMLLVGDHALPLAYRIVERLAEPIELDVGPVTIGGSVGVASADDRSTVMSLLRDADAAMYDAKARGKNRVSVFVPAMHDGYVERLLLRTELDAAMANDELRLVYQPKLRLGDGHVEGFEALLRWARSDGTTVSPADFVPVAESTGQIVAIGAWVLRTALAQLAAWQRGGEHPALSMAVNVSTRQLASPRFVDDVRDALASSGVDPSSVTLEVTETMLMADTTDAAAVLGELRALGVSIAIDDYGAGHASIGYLRRLPINVLKIDRSFVAALDSQPQEAEAYLRSITELARSLRLETVAEGIEHSGQLDHLRDLGCTSGQGFHLARPLSVTDATAFLAEHDRRREVA